MRVFVESVRELHELLGMPTYDVTVSLTRSRLGPSAKASSPNPDEAATRNGLDAL